MNTSKNLVVCNTEISRDDDGLYSLNDLHKAAGGEIKHAPANFMRLDQTQALIAEIGNSAEVQSFKTKEGRNGGTYVCRELLLYYATWISPKFHLHVLRAYDALVTGQPTQSPNQPLQMNLEQAATAIMLMRSVTSECGFDRKGTLEGYLNIERALGLNGLIPVHLFHDKFQEVREIDHPSPVPYEQTFGGDTRSLHTLFVKANLPIGFSAFQQILIAHEVMVETDNKVLVLKDSRFGINSNGRTYWYVDMFETLLGEVIPASWNRA